MSPEYFVIPLIMGQASGIIDAMKTGIIFLDFSILLFFLFLFYTSDANYIFKYITQWNENKKNTIVIKSELRTRSIRFRAIMHFLAKHMKQFIVCVKMLILIGMIWKNEVNI